MAVLVFAQIAIGVYAADLPVGIQRLVWLSRHKSIGITILALMLMRLAWRLATSPPPPSPDLPAWQRQAASLTHWAFYILLTGSALVGWLAASAYGLSVNWFGLVLLPDLVGKNKALADALQSAHELLVWSVSALIVLHVAAALHHAVRRDGVVSRMLP